MGYQIKQKLYQESRLKWSMYPSLPFIRITLKHVFLSFPFGLGFLNGKDL